MPVVQSLWIYPVKSLAGLAVEQAQVGEGGFVDDRRWMLVQRDTGKFMSQRTLPRMALIHPLLDDDTLTLRAEGFGQIALSRDASGPKRQVGVWSDRFEAMEVSDDVSAWCSEVLGQQCTLVRKLPQTRQVKAKYVENLDVVDEVSFADAFPYLLVGSATLDELNSKLDQPVTMRRFRPNIVVETTSPGVEDHWRVLSHAHGLRLYFRKPCDRCNLVNVDPQTGQPSKEPLKTLATYRRGVDGKVYFGQNVVHTGQGVLRVGDLLEHTQEV